MKKPIYVLILIACMSLMQNAAGQSREDADALLADSQWQAAADAYQLVIEASPDDAAAWFGLAQANHQLELYAEAETAYLEALANGFQPALRAHYHLARAYMSDQKQELALAQLEAIANIGGLSSQVLLGTAEFGPLGEEPRFAAVIEQLTPCNTEHYRQFDFWLGEWDVTPAGAPAATAHNSITSAQGGCVVLEQYETQTGYTGMSINFFDSVTGLWHQTWMGSGGGAVYLEGGLENGAMVLSDAELPVSRVAGTINRVTWTALEDGRVRQHWQNSSDGGENWTTSFDGYYARSENADQR